EHRRLMRQRLPDYDAHRHRRVSALVAPGPENELRDVDDDGRLLEVGRRPAPALQRPLDLARADAERHVELLERARADDAVGREAVAGLEALHRVHERAAVDLRVDARVLREVADAAE